MVRIIAYTYLCCVHIILFQLVKLFGNGPKITVRAPLCVLPIWKIQLWYTDDFGRNCFRKFMGKNVMLYKRNNNNFDQNQDSNQFLFCESF